MIIIDKNKIVKTDLANIVDNYQVLLDDIEPILFTGTNSLGNRIVGSLTSRDFESGINRYLHAVIDSMVYNEFLKQCINYNGLLKRAKLIYIIDQSFNRDEEKIYQINYDDIPHEYLPLKS